MKKTRSAEEMPTVTQVVRIAPCSSSPRKGTLGVVTKKERTFGGSRPYTVRFNDGTRLKFRNSDVFVANK